MMVDRHDRFIAWLNGGAVGDPPRDVAVHAALCAECLRRIAALDALRTIDMARAPLPLVRPLARFAAGGLRSAGRFAAAAAATTLALSAVAFGISRLTALQIGNGPAQEVLGVQGSPEPSVTTSPLPTLSFLASSSPSPTPTGLPRTPSTRAPAPVFTSRPTVRQIVRPSASPMPGPTPSPSAPASASAQPSARPSASPSAQPSASQSAQSTTSPTAAPTETPTPTP